MAAYYNEFDKGAAQWLRELIKMGLIADGVVDDRSIVDVQPSDLTGFTQCHFFAGIGGWSHALRLSGISDETHAWTGSCPCQPFSTSGTHKGIKDERHLWPEFYRLIKECAPDLIFGEQVAGKAGLGWLDLVQSDLENSDYTCGAAVTAACGVGAPHQRKRLYWVAHSDGCRQQGQGSIQQPCSTTANKDRKVYRTVDVSGGSHRDTHDKWHNPDWLYCQDEKRRPVEPGTFPLAYELSSELVCSSDLSVKDVERTKEAKTIRIKGYGNAIVPAQAQQFIEAFMEYAALRGDFL